VGDREGRLPRWLLTSPSPLYDCNGCEECEAKQPPGVPPPREIPPRDDFMGIDVYATVRKFGLPIEVLTDREQRQNRYSFIFIT